MIKKDLSAYAVYPRAIVLGYGKINILKKIFFRKKKLYYIFHLFFQYVSEKYFSIFSPFENVQLITQH